MIWLVLAEFAVVAFCCFALRNHIRNEGMLLKEIRRLNGRVAAMKACVDIAQTELAEVHRRNVILEDQLGDREWSQVDSIP